MTFFYRSTALVALVLLKGAHGVVDISAELRQAVTVDGILSHLQAFQAIADRHSNNRFTGTDGYHESVAYVVAQLQDAGYNVTQQEFEFREGQNAVNIITETAAGQDDWVVVVGGHLDSVKRGPGINDNGSGSAAILEIAIQMSKLRIVPKNKVRFFWFAAEELGLLGANAYLQSLTAEEIGKMALMLCFDMIGSPNYVRFVYDGDGSSSIDRFTGEPIAGPPGSDLIEKVFVDYFNDQGLATDPIRLGPYSDYHLFINEGIPVGGLFSGTDFRKTDEQATIYGGKADQALDPCYHKACDSIDNLSLQALDELGDAAAHAVMVFATS